MKQKTNNSKILTNNIGILIVSYKFYSAHKSKVEGTSFLTVLNQNKIDRQGVKIQRVRQAVRRLRWMVFGANTAKLVRMREGTNIGLVAFFNRSCSKGSAQILTKRPSICFHLNMASKLGTPSALT